MRERKSCIPSGVRSPAASASRQPFLRPKGASSPRRYASKRRRGSTRPKRGASRPASSSRPFAHPSASFTSVMLGTSSRAERPNRGCSTKPLVPGLIYYGALHLFLGPAKTGKSSSLLELATKTASHLGLDAPPPTWWGVPIDKLGEPPLVVFWIGEEHLAEVARRYRALNAAGFDGPRLQMMPGGRAGLMAYLKRFDGTKSAPPSPTLMVVD